MKFITNQIAAFEAAKVEISNRFDSPLHKQIVIEEANSIIESLKNLVTIKPQRNN